MSTPAVAPASPAPSSAAAAPTGHRPRRRWGLAFRLCLSLIAAAFVTVFYVVQYYQPAPIEVVMRGDGVAMGTAYGKACHYRMKLLLNLYLRHVVCQGDADLLRRRAALAVATLDVDPVYHTELNAMAAAAGVNVAELTYGNTFLDQGGAAAVGCRSVVVQRERAGLLHGHNLDWNDLAGLGKFSVVILRRTPDDGRLRTVAIGFPGLLGTLDVINESGVALSFNQLGTGRGATAEPVWLMMRRIAEHRRTFAEARADLLAAPPGMAFLITLSDAKTGETAIFERTHENIVERTPQGGVIAGDNNAMDHFVRSSPFIQAVCATPIRTPGDLQRTLRSPQVLRPDNLYSVIWDFQANTFYLASGDIPAAERVPYRQFALF